MDRDLLNNAVEVLNATIEALTEYRDSLTEALGSTSSQIVPEAISPTEDFVGIYESSIQEPLQYLTESLNEDLP